MKKGINKVFLMGLVVSDPKFYMHQDTSVAKLTIVTSVDYKDKNSYEKKDIPEYHHVVFFGKLAAIVKDLILKGFKIHVEGYLKTSKWQDKDSGENRSSTEIVGTSMQIVYGFKEDSPNPLKNGNTKKIDNQKQEYYEDDNFNNFDFSFENHLF